MRTTIVLALLVALIAPASAQTIVYFRSPAVGRSAMLDAYLYQPSGGRRHPAVVFMHGCSGLVRDGHPESRAMQWERTLTKLGFVVLMVDSFTSRGVQNMCEPAKFDERIYTARPFDAVAALQFLQKQAFVDPSRIGIMG
ncbi:MAG: dienelactone hydrolase family protein, partial [Vulcanimicrobiaceae bacterium]